MGSFTSSITKVAPTLALAGAIVFATSAAATYPAPDPCNNVPLVWYKMNEASWNGYAAEVDNAGSLGDALDAIATCDANLRPGCANELPRPPRGLPSTMFGAPSFFNAARQRTSKPGCGPSGYFNYLGRPVRWRSAVASRSVHVQ